MTTQTTATTNGLVTLGPEASDLLRRLDDLFGGWAQGWGADSMTMPPLLPVSDMVTLDLFSSFPHLALVASRLRTQALGTWGAGERVPADCLEAGEFVLPSAACYAVYLHLRGRTLDGPVLVTVCGRCFRNEVAYDGLRRALGFHMREAVCIGTLEETRGHLERFAQRITAFAAALGLSLRRATATDPFFDPQGPRAVLQQLSPVKHEFVIEDLAIASVNLHRNFFGERCAIRLPDGGGWAFSSCVAFGLERWVSVLSQRFGGDWTAIAAAVEGARLATLTAAPARAAPVPHPPPATPPTSITPEEPGS